MVDVLRAFSSSRKMTIPKHIFETINGRSAIPEDVLEFLPAEITEKFTSRNGNPKKERFDRFIRNIRKCIKNGFTTSQLLQMDDQCVNNKGHIDEVRLKRIIAGEFDD